LTRHAAAYVFHGSGTGIPDGDPTTAATRLTPPAWDSAQFGYDVAAAGDVNGDGYADVIVGAPWIAAAYLFHGSATGIPDSSADTASAAITTSSPSDHSSLGASVAAAGDLNGDGYGDVIVGNPAFEFPSDRPRSEAFVYYGSASGVAGGDVSTAPTHLTTDQAGAQFGIVAGAGDLDGDGYADVIVGAPFWDDGEVVQAGAVFLFRGSATGIASGDTTTAAQQFVGAASNDELGWSVAPAGDTNGDSRPDVIAGAPGYSGTASGAGHALVLLPETHRAMAFVCGAFLVAVLSRRRTPGFGSSSPHDWGHG
jgi:hypothetical protein